MIVGYALCGIPDNNEIQRGDHAGSPLTPFYYNVKITKAKKLAYLEMYSIEELNIASKIKKEVH